MSDKPVIGKITFGKNVEPKTAMELTMEADKMIGDIIKEKDKRIRELEEGLRRSQDALRGSATINGRLEDRISELEQANNQQALTIFDQDKRISELEAERDDANRVMKEACEANRVFNKRIRELERKYDALVEEIKQLDYGLYRRFPERASTSYEGWDIVKGVRGELRALLEELNDE